MGIRVAWEVVSIGYEGKDSNLLGTLSKISGKKCSKIVKISIFRTDPTGGVFTSQRTSNNMGGSSGPNEHREEGFKVVSVPEKILWGRKCVLRQILRVKLPLKIE